MKEKEFNKMVNRLTKRGFIELCPLCSGCVGDTVADVLKVFTNANFSVYQVEDDLFCLRINV